MFLCGFFLFGWFGGFWFWVVLFFLFILVQEGWNHFRVWCSALRPALEFILPSSWQVFLKDHKALEQN